MIISDILINLSILLIPIYGLLLFLSKKALNRELNKEDIFDRDMKFIAQKQFDVKILRLFIVITLITNVIFLYDDNRIISDNEFSETINSLKNKTKECVKEIDISNMKNFVFQEEVQKCLSLHKKTN